MTVGPDLTGRVIVITGSAGLLGREHALAVADCGGLPVMLDRDTERNEAAAAFVVQHSGVEALPLHVDIAIEDSVRETCAAVLDRFGKVDGLINNAANNPRVEDGSTRFSRLENFEMASWEADLAVGLTGAFLCAKYFGQAIFETSSCGSIVNVSSDLGLIAPDQRLYEVTGLGADEQPVKPVTYSVVKTGMIGLTRYLSTYWRREGRVTVRCNAICPGGVANHQPRSFVSDVSQRIPLGRMAEATELRGIVAFLLSDSASYVNGAIIPVDGGRSAW